MDPSFTIYVVIVGLVIVGMIVYLLSPWIQPEVWLREDGLYLQKYFKPQKVPLEKIDHIRMALKTEADDFGYGYLLTLKITLKDGSICTETRGELKNQKFTIGSLFKNYDLALLPRSQTLQKIIHQHPGIKLDEFTKEYIQTGDVQKFINLIS